MGMGNKPKLQLFYCISIFLFLPTSTGIIMYNVVLVSVCRSPVCEEIINCRGDHVRLGVRVKVYPYPENAIATWIMFACKYKSVL